MNPIALLFLLFLAIPIVEIYLLIQVGGIIGAPLTIFLVIFTAMLGAWLLRVQGFATIQRIQQTLSQGGLPAVELMEGAVLLIAGALLLTPGFFTDAIGFICLVPAIRRAIVLYIVRRLASTKSEEGYEFHVERHEKTQSSQTPAHPHKTHTLEGEYTREDD